MIHRLAIHPQSQHRQPAALHVHSLYANDQLLLEYQLQGDLDRIALPAPARPARADFLWQASCAELFIASDDAMLKSKTTPYIEWNFSPSGQWAAYRFAGYRAEMQPLDRATDPQIKLAQSDGELRLSVTLNLPDLYQILGDDPGGWRLGLSAIIKDEQGNSAWWALTHPPGKADFHHPDCFAARLMAQPMDQSADEQ